MILGVIQARFGSKRLPRKVLKPLLDKPMLLHIVNRLKSSSYIEMMAIATTDYSEDNAIEDFAKENKIGCYRGKELDIVDRLYQTGRKYKASTIVRIWGDCPLIDPIIVDRTISEFLKENADYASNLNPPTYPRGMDVEVYAIETLEKIINDTEDPFHREYPKEYIINKSREFNIVNVENNVNLSHLHWTVDYMEDFKFVERVYEELYKKNHLFTMQDILNLLEKNKAFREMNKNLRRNIEYYEALELREK